MKQKLSDYGINGDDNSKEYSNPQTAVEFLLEQITLFKGQKGVVFLTPYLTKEILEQVKEIEKEQIKNSYHSGTIDGLNFRTTSISPNPEQYYNETFKSE